MNEDLQNYLNEIRRDFSGKPLDVTSVNPDPFVQFSEWFEEAVNAQLMDPYAMALTTISTEGKPSTRIVYLRGVNENGFVFYTNYNSHKGKDMAANNLVALNFLWTGLERQIRIEGKAVKVSAEVSDLYFSKRPRESQIGAWASAQSDELTSREELEQKVHTYTDKFKDKEVPRPPHWGGYLVIPEKIEYWQGRPNRLHDRIVYEKNGEEWMLKRLSP